ncbi:Exonuclease 1 [Linum perenne]
MGIKDLLRFMKPYIESVHIKKYAGKRVGIDAYCWLHKGAYSCSMEICLDSKSERKLRYLDYFMHRINLLIHHKIIPVVVLDGANIPCKSSTEHERRRKREANHELAVAKLKEGDASSAREFFQRAVNITPSMAHQLIQILKSKKVEFVVAPYEADAQLAYLSSLGEARGGVSAVITEDSDLLAYGCKATIFKMDQHGNGEELVLDGVFDPEASRKPSFQHFNMELFTGMCVLAGCDFLSSVPGIGIVKAYMIVSKYRNLDRVLSVLKLDKGAQMPEDYIYSFREALAVFQHARIYDPKAKSIKPMKPLPQDLSEYFSGKLDFLGPEMPSSVATAIAEGTTNPLSMEPFDCLLSSSTSETVITSVLSDSFNSNKPEVITSFSRKCSFVDAEAFHEKENLCEESKYISEALALHRIAASSETQTETKPAIAPVEIPLKIHNNPFIIKKSSDNSSISCITQFDDNNDDDVAVTTPENASKKRKLMNATIAEETMSEVTELEQSVDMFDDAKESQESVNSKLKKVGRVQMRKKKGSLTGSGGNNSSILSFFSRV